MKITLLDVGVLLGCMLALAGVWMIYRPAAIILAGLAVAGGCWFADYGRGRGGSRS